MSSKYIPKSRLSRIAPAFEWSTDSVDFRTIVEDYKNPLTAEKERIESIPLEQLEFTDLYEFPFHISKYGGWVYDAKGKTESKGGQIFINDQLAITIRGWGRLTGTGAYNLDGEWAGKIQDSLQKFIVEKLAQEK